MRLLITKLFLSCFIFSFLTSNFIYSQEIKGQIIDKKTNNSVAFVTILIKNKNKGVVTDDNGFFRLPLYYKNQKDTILVSSIGYKTKQVILNTLLDSIINIIKIQPKTEFLDAVVLVSKNKTKNNRQLSASDIVKKAIQKLPVNFPTSPSSVIGYYRDYQLLNNKYFNLNEAIIEVFDSGFHTNKLRYHNNQSVLYEYQTNPQFPRDSALALAYGGNNMKYIVDAKISPMGGNELSILNIHNPIRYNDSFSFSFAGVFRESFLYNHAFIIEKIVYLNETPIYQIKFFALKEISGTNNTANGVIYISMDNFAIHKLEYNGFRSDEKKPFFTVKVEYLPKGKLMYLNYISFNNNFELRSKKDFKIVDISYDINDNSFYITFNNEVKESSINKNRNYSFSFKKKELVFKNIKLIKPKVIKIQLKTGTLKDFYTYGISNKKIFLYNLKDQEEYFDYKIKNILDIAERKLNKVNTLKVNQFRELFVQEVFQKKELPTDVKFIDKEFPISEAIINPFEKKSKYWVNTPLKITKE